MKRMLIVMGIAGAVVAAAIVFILLKQDGNPHAAARESPEVRMRAHMREFPKYRFLVRTAGNSSQDSRWEDVTDIHGDVFTLQNGTTVSLLDARAALAVYPNGEILTACGQFHPLPDGYHFLTYSEERITLLPQQMEEGNRFLRVSYSRTDVPSDAEPLYVTTLTNVSDEPLRVVKFCPMAPVPGVFISDIFYTDEQFRSWYGVDETDEWIAPGASVADASNFGPPPVLWAYFLETKTGKTLVAGALLEKMP